MPEERVKFDPLTSPLLGEDDPMNSLREIAEEETYRLEHEKFRFYEPNGKCEEFIKKVGSGDFFIVFFAAANGVGKTAAGANIVAHICYGKSSGNKYFDLPLFKNFPYPKRGRIVSDSDAIEKNLVPTLEEWLPAGRYKKRKAGKHFDSIWKTDTNFEFDIMTYEQDPKEFEAATLGWAMFDEPPPESIFKATVARMRKGGIIFITATPLKGSAWLYDHIIANPDKDLEAKGQRTYVEADVEDACIEHGIRGHLEHANIERMIAEYTEDEKQARAHGKFQHLVGLRFKNFSRNIHVIKPFQIDKMNWTVYHALDTHPRNNDMGNWIAVNDKGMKIVVDELWIKCEQGTEELAQRIKDKDEKFRIESRILEPGAFVEDQHENDEAKKTLAKKLSSYGLNYVPATKLREQSDKEIEDALTYSKIKVGEAKEFIRKPDLYIFDTCQRTIFEFEHYSWDDWSGRSAEKHNQKEKTIDKDDHAIENIGRILIRKPVFVPMPKADDYVPDMPNYDPYN
jgi:phage terminase large subunit-like protein